MIAEVKNIGSTWVKMQGFESDYTITATDGSVATTGTFSYAFPTYLAPGETGYLATDVSVENLNAEDLESAEANSYFDEAQEADATILTVDNIKNRLGDEYSSTITTGKVTNTSGDDVESFHVGAFYLNADGKPIGFSYSNLGQNLAAGQTKAFETLSGGPYGPLKNVAETVVLAASSDF